MFNGGFGQQNASDKNTMVQVSSNKYFSLAPPEIFCRFSVLGSQGVLIFDFRFLLNNWTSLRIWYPTQILIFPKFIKGCEIPVEVRNEFQMFAFCFLIRLMKAKEILYFWSFDKFVKVNEMHGPSPKPIYAKQNSALNIFGFIRRIWGKN